jgi:excisionase family DNA binding protein
MRKVEKPLNVAQTAHFLGLKKGTLYNMISRKAIPHHKVGRRVLFREAELEAWFESTLIPCIPNPHGGKEKPQKTNMDVEAIVKNAVEQYTLW